MDTNQFISTLPLKRDFHDAHEKRAYLRAVATARRLLEDPGLLSRGAEHLERFTRPDPRQSSHYALWREVLAGGEAEVVRRLLADTDEGMALRDSSPVFVRFAPEELKAIWIDADAK
ncbi:MAG: hypothetical protein Q7T19_02795 [Caulobacter sp.]|nr:hypothetical protein [Caulobacter sp.]